MKCIYCDSTIFGKEKTNEHVIPQWIIKKLDIKKKQLSFTPISEDLKTHKIRTPVPHTLTYKVCNICNNGWLAEIDESSKEFLESLIDGYFNLNFFTYENLVNLRTLVYKILLNFLATGPEDFKIKKYIFYKEFYKTRIAPENTALFFTPIKNNENFSINHLDYWASLTETPINSENLGFRFKIYLQLGKIAMVLCSTGAKNIDIIYDNRFLDLILADSSVRGTEFSTIFPYDERLPDTYINLFLYNSIHQIKKPN